MEAILGTPGNSKAILDCKFIIEVILGDCGLTLDFTILWITLKMEWSENGTEMQYKQRPILNSFRCYFIKISRI